MSNIIYTKGSIIVANLFTDSLQSLTFEDLEHWATREPIPREGEFLEFKKDFSESVPIEIVALGNHVGGVILIGVDEMRSGNAPKTVKWPPPGIRLDRCVDTLQNLCHQYIRPSYVPDWHAIPLPSQPNVGMLILRIDPESVPRPLWHAEKGVLKRLGESSRPADLDALRSLFAEEQTGAHALNEFNVQASHVADANVDGAWLGCVLQFRQGAATFDSNVKRRLMETFTEWFWVPPTDVYQRPPHRITSRGGSISIEIPSQTRTPWLKAWIKASGLLLFQARTESCPVRVQWILNALSRLFALITDDERFTQVFRAAHGIHVQLSLSNWPKEGLSPAGLFAVPRTDVPDLEGSRVAQYYGPLSRTREAFLQLEEDFLTQCLDDSAYLGHEDPLRRTVRDWGWSHPGMTYFPEG